MKRFRSLPLWLLLTPVLLTTGVSVANAQPAGDPFDGGPLFDDGPGRGRPPGGPGGPGGWGGPGGPGRPGGGRGPGAKGHLDGVLHGLERLNGTASDLSKAQAQKAVALLKPWSNKPAMSDADAQKLATSLEAVFTSAQKSKLGPSGRGGRGDRRGPPPGGGDFGPPPGGEDGPPPDGDFGPPDGDFGPLPGGRGGPGGQGGQGRGPGPGGGPPKGRGVMPASFNPLYAPTGRSDWKKLPSSTQQLLARRYRENRAILERLSRRSK